MNVPRLLALAQGGALKAMQGVVLLARLVCLEALAISVSAQRREDEEDRQHSEF